MFNLYTSEFSNLIVGAGLTNLWESVRDNWIGPLFLAAVAIGAFMFIRSQQITKLIMFLVVASIVGVLIFFGDSLFGSNGALSKMFKGTANSVGNDNSNGI
jgi:hypothetical protein